MANSRLKVVLNQVHSASPGVTIQNVFWYEGDGGTVAAAPFAAAFEDQVLDNIAVLQSSMVSYPSIEVTDIDDPSNFAVHVPTTILTGSVAGTDWLPLYLAMSFQLIRASHASRHGWKRFTGLMESTVSGNTLATAQLEWAGLLENALAARVNMFPLGAYPRIARRPAPGFPITDTEFFNISNVMFRGLSTQNTRKK